MKHIVIDARELRTSTGRYVERLIHYLQAVDTIHRYTILLTAKDFDGWQPTNPNFHKLKTPYKEFTFGEQLGFWRQITALHADLVHFPMIQQPVLYGGRVVTTIQDLTTIRFRNPSKNWLVFTIKREVYKLVTRIVARKSKHIITVSEFVKKDVLNYAHVPPSKITVTLEAADRIPEPAVPLSQLVGKQFILYVGRPLPHKNLPRLIDAFVDLKGKHPHLVLVLAGKKDILYERIEQMVITRGIPDVVFAGFVSEGELKWLYQHTACYVFPSLSEGFGLPGLEAMVHGAPVASSNATSLPEINGHAARYFNPYNTQELSTTIDEIISDPNISNKLRTDGEAHSICFSWHKMANITFSVYQKILDEDTAP